MDYIKLKTNTKNWKPEVYERSESGRNDMMPRPNPLIVFEELDESSSSDLNVSSWYYKSRQNLNNIKISD